MILLINKYHRVENGETTASVKVEKTTDVETYREAKKQAYQFAANYMADTSVIDWAISIVNPKTCKVEMQESYFSPVVVEEQTEEIPAE